MGTGASRHRKSNGAKSAKKPRRSVHTEDLEVESVKSLTEIIEKCEKHVQYGKKKYKEIERNDTGDIATQGFIKRGVVLKKDRRFVSDNGDYFKPRTRIENDVIVEDIEGYELFLSDGKFLSNSNNSSNYELRLPRSRIPVLTRQAKFARRVRPSTRRRLKGIDRSILYRCNDGGAATRGSCWRVSKPSTDEKQPLSPVKHPGLSSRERHLIEELHKQGIIENASRAKSKAIIRELLHVGLVRGAKVRTESEIGELEPEVIPLLKRDQLPPLETDAAVVVSDSEMGDLDDGKNVDVRFLKNIKVKVKRKETEKLKVKILDLDLL